MNDVFIPADDAAYRQWLRSQTGYVLNGDRARKKSHYPRLHRSSCHLVSSNERDNFVDKTYYKVCSPTASALQDWTIKNLGRKPTLCGVCHS